MPGTGRVDEICQHFDSGIAKVPGTGLAFRLGDCKGAWHRVGGLICKHPGTVAKVPGTGLEGWFASIQARLQRCLAPGGIQARLQRCLAPGGSTGWQLEWHCTA